MAALESLALVLQITANLEGLRRDMRANATRYQAQVNSGADPKTLASVMTEDAAEYQKRLDWLTPFFTDSAKLAILTDGFARLGMTEKDAQDMLTQLQPVVAAQASAAKNVTQPSDITNAVTATLTAVEPHESLWPVAGTVNEPVVVTAAPAILG